MIAIVPVLPATVGRVSREEQKQPMTRFAGRRKSDPEKFSDAASSDPVNRMPGKSFPFGSCRITQALFERGWGVKEERKNAMSA